MSMDTGGNISIQDAIESFKSIMRSLNAFDQQSFLLFIAENWKPGDVKIHSLSRGNRAECSPQEAQLENIKNIAIDIRNRVPFDGILPSENIIPPTIGENSDCDEKSTKHIDAFLYDDIEVEELIEEGQLENLYCTHCGSSNVKEYNIISHSLSVSAMVYIFHSALPSLEGKTLLDIGSRLGAVLYGAHIFTSAKRIIGVEMNKELCTLQSDIINKYNMSDRVEIMNKRIEDCPDMVQQSDVIVMNNPFEFYVPETVHAEIWKFLKSNIRSGTYLVVRPPMETTFKTLKTGISVSEWVKPYEPKSLEEPVFFGSLVLEASHHPDIKFYQVL